MGNKNGFTLVEVMVASTIFLIATGILFTGGNTAVQMQRRTVELEQERDMLEASLAQKEEGIPGIVSLHVDGICEISGDGWLFCGKTHVTEDTSVEIIYVEAPDPPFPNREDFAVTNSNAETATDTNAKECMQNEE